MHLLIQLLKVMIRFKKETNEKYFKTNTQEDSNYNSQNLQALQGEKQHNLWSMWKRSAEYLLVSKCSLLATSWAISVNLSSHLHGSYAAFYLK